MKILPEKKKLVDLKIETIEYKWFCSNCSTTNWETENEKEVECTDCGERFEVRNTRKLAIDKACDVERLREIIDKAEDCPDCDNSGVGRLREIIDKAEDCTNCDNSGVSCRGQYSNDEFEIEQCYFCYTNPNSKFNIPEAISAHVRACLEEGR